MTTDFAGKHIVITGGSGGLGQAVVAAFLDRGAICHVPIPMAAQDMEPVPWGAHPSVHLQHDVDLSDEDAVVSYYAALPPLWASIHLVGGFAMAPVTETSLEDFQRMMTLNAATCFLCCREAIKGMRNATMSQGSGRIVNVAARPAVQPAGGMIAYTASKAAVVSMTQSLAVELRAEDILVNAVVPSLFDTPTNRAAMPSASFDAWPTPAEIATTICFLASPQNRLSSGALIPVYGRV